MTGDTLQAQMHLIAAAFGPVRTLITAIARCHLEVEKLVAAPYASGLACLVEDEMDLGSLVIDMGAGTTSFAVFFDGNVVFADGIAMGGAHVTNDIARGLTTSLACAERLKTLYGNAIPSPMDEREIVDVPLVGEELPENANPVPKAQLIRIIQPRIEETLELLRSRLDKSGFSDVAGRRVVLTGGASQLPGIRELAQRMLDKQVRLGRPLRVARPTSHSSKSGGASFTGLGRSDIGARFRYDSWFTGRRHAAGTGGFVKHRRARHERQRQYLLPRRSMDEAEFVKRNDKMEASRKGIFARFTHYIHFAR